MASTASLTASPTRLNVADRLAQAAAKLPNAVAIVCPRHSSPNYAQSPGPSGANYSTTTFAELDADATRIKQGLIAWGVPPGTRLALLVRPGIEFVTLVFALLRAGMVIVLIDPGLGRRNMIRCLSEVEPEGFVAIPAAQAVRTVLRHKFPRARWNVTLGHRWFWGGKTLKEVRNIGSSLRTPHSTLPTTSPDSAAAIIFTSGSTGPAKGVLYTHRMFDTQVADIQSQYNIEPGGIDLGCFPLFALFNSAMGVTTVLPEMDFSRPAAADPNKLLAAANDWQVTQAFASPAVWRVVSEHCAKTGDRIPSLKQVFSCGAPVRADVIRATLACVAPNAKMHTPYGATECLPVATIEASEILHETAAKTDTGAGVCVGHKFDSIDWRVIRITDDPIATLDDAEELRLGEIGELIIRGPQASPRYVTQIKKNALAKIAVERAGASPPPAGAEDGPAHHEINDHPLPWHRMGDVGYLDDQNRFWYCGRKSQRVETTNCTLFTEVVEAVFNLHPQVRRSALVGVGKYGSQQPVVVYERKPLFSLYPGGRCNPPEVYEALANELRQLARDNPVTQAVEVFLPHSSLPVDVRHNAKINREALAIWAAEQLRQMPASSHPQPPAPNP